MINNQWDEVIKEIDIDPICFGKYLSYWFRNTPRRTLHSLSYYKFASKLIGKNKKVLDVGCNEGIGTFLLAKECGFAKGIDFDEEAIESAKKNFSANNLEFSSENFLINSDKETWDAITSFDVIEHISLKNEALFFKQIINKLSKEGIAIIGTPSEISQKYASELSKAGHINIYSPERLELVMRKYFSYFFIFAANDEVVHTGYLPLAHYLIGIGGCKKG